MKTTLRITLTVACFVGTFYFVYWMGGAFLSMLGLPNAAQDGTAFIVALVAAIAMAVFIWKYGTAESGGLFVCVVKGAFIVGAIGFIAGFIGPMIFAPGANQGPLLGLFYTGPLGFLAGAVGGAVYWAAKVRPQKRRA